MPGTVLSNILQTLSQLQQGWHQDDVTEAQRTVACPQSPSWRRDESWGGTHIGLTATLAHCPLCKSDRQLAYCLHVEKLRLREVATLVQGHRAG